jgi:uncharacterized damage-inducible protein DinB
MKRAALAALALALPLFSAGPEPLLTMEEFTSEWKVSRDFTIAVAEKMPAAFYSFKPNPDERTFGEQLVHLAYAAAGRYRQLTGQPPFHEPPPDPNNRAAVLRFLKVSFDDVINTLPRIAPEHLKKTFPIDWKGRPEVSGRQIMLGMFVHTAHHRAQCEVYLRAKGIVPPDYLF